MLMEKYSSQIRGVLSRKRVFLLFGVLIIVAVGAAVFVMRSQQKETIIISQQDQQTLRVNKEIGELETILGYGQAGKHEEVINEAKRFLEQSDNGITSQLTVANSCVQSSRVLDRADDAAVCSAKARELMKATDDVEFMQAWEEVIRRSEQGIEYKDPADAEILY
jgi:hypothetical protein